MTNIRNALMQAAGSAGGDPVYVEDVFSTYLYTGNNSVSTQTFNTGLDMAGEGGMIWFKSRTSSQVARIMDTERGTRASLIPSSNAANSNLGADGLTYLSNGFSIGWTGGDLASAQDYVSWSFRKQTGFFDVLTYTGDGATSKAINHNLGCKPGMIIIKMTTTAGYIWRVWHKSLVSLSGANYALSLNNSNVADNGTATGGFWNSTAPTSTQFTVGDYGQVNNNGDTFVAYLFADGDESDAQIFGDDSDESIVKMGTYTGNGSANGPVINLGWEPQMIIIKAANYSCEWGIYDNMRGVDLTTAAQLHPNTDGAEYNQDVLRFLATGFQPKGTSCNTNHTVNYIYIAFRRGPMKEPDAGTDVYAASSISGGDDDVQLTTGNLVDLGWQYLSGNGAYFFTRLLGEGYLNPTSTLALNTSANSKFDYMDGFMPDYAGNISGFSPRQVYGFRRYPKVFDMVVYNGNATAPMDVKHNLGVAAELLIFKKTSATEDWNVLNTQYTDPNGYANTGRMFINTNAAYGSTGWGGTLSSATAITVNTSYFLNQTGSTYVAYLFATLAGISKVGVYTGTGNDLNVDCGFSGGARFILIKRADDTGDWYVYDSVRGIVAGDDPYYFLNSTVAQVTNTDYIDPLASGFTVTSSAPDALNASGGKYLFLAFA